jgi:hypothetical protein
MSCTPPEASRYVSSAEARILSFDDQALELPLVSSLSRACTWSMTKTYRSQPSVRRAACNREQKQQPNLDIHHGLAELASCNKCHLQ